MDFERQGVNQLEIVLAGYAEASWVINNGGFGSYATLIPATHEAAALPSDRRSRPGRDSTANLYDPPG